MFIDEIVSKIYNLCDTKVKEKCKAKYICYRSAGVCGYCSLRALIKPYIDRETSQIHFQDKEDLRIFINNLYNEIEKNHMALDILKYLLMEEAQCLLENK